MRAPLLPPKLLTPPVIWTVPLPLRRTPPVVPVMAPVMFSMLLVLLKRSWEPLPKAIAP